MLSPRVVSCGTLQQPAVLRLVTHASGTDRLLRIEDVAELANVHRDTVHRWIKDGHLQPVGRTPSGSPRFTRQQVLDLLRNPRQHDTDVPTDPNPTDPTLTTTVLGRPS